MAGGASSCSAARHRVVVQCYSGQLYNNFGLTVSESSKLVLRALPTTLLLLGTFLERSERLGLERVLGTFRTQAVCRSGQLSLRGHDTQTCVAAAARGCALAVVPRTGSPAPASTSCRRRAVPRPTQYSGSTGGNGSRGVEPGAALMTARPRGGPASNRPRESAFPKLSASHRIEEGLLPMSLKIAPKSSKEG